MPIIIPKFSRGFPLTPLHGTQIRSGIFKNPIIFPFFPTSALFFQRTVTPTKKLLIDEEEAKTVRLIFEKYMALESIQATVSEINRLGLKTREWVSVSTGKKHTAKTWNTSSIHRILTSPIYAGYVSHYDTNYEGEHEAIIPRPQWEKVQQMLSARSPLPRGQKHQR